MSNHAIGYAMGRFVIDILPYKESGDITSNAFEAILKSCEKVIIHEDGNDYELYYPLIDAGICPSCYKKSDTLIDLYNLPDEYSHLAPIVEACEASGNYFKASKFCSECLKRLESC